MYTSYVSNALVEGAWRKLETTMENKGIDCAKVDGAGVCSPLPRVTMAA